MNRDKPIVAIDGPVGVGKSTVASTLAKRLAFIHIDTGAMYRTVTWKALQENIDLENRRAVTKIARNIDIQIIRDDSTQRVLCDGEDVSEVIRTPEVSQGTGPVADNLAVRECLVAKQQELGKEGGVVMEGRDIATVVFPDAEIKIYLDADPKIRAERRYNEEIAKGKETTFEQTYEDLMQRDQRDRERPFGALKVAEGAIVVDTTHLSQEEVVDRLAELVRRRYPDM